MKNIERGSVLIEGMWCCLVLVIVGMGFMAIYQLFTVQLASDYAAFQVARARSLGYSDFIVQRAGRLAASAVSGADISRVPLRGIPTFGAANARAHDYLVYGLGINNRYGVSFAFWDKGENQSSGADLETLGRATPDKNLGKESELTQTWLGIGTETLQEDGVDCVRAKVQFHQYPLALRRLFSFFRGDADEFFEMPAGSATLRDHSAAYLEDNAP